MRDIILLRSLRLAATHVLTTAASPSRVQSGGSCTQDILARTASSHGLLSLHMSVVLHICQLPAQHKVHCCRLVSLE